MSPLSELQSQLLAVETEMSNKNKEIQTLHSSLTDTIVSKDQVEQKVMQLLEVSQHSLAEDSVQVQVGEHSPYCCNDRCDVYNNSTFSMIYSSTWMLWLLCGQVVFTLSNLSETRERGN